MPKLTPAALHLLTEIAAGRDLVFYLTDRPTGWVHLERHGLAVPDPHNDSRAVLTDAGRYLLGQGSPPGTGRIDPGILARARLAAELAPPRLAPKHFPR